MTSAKLCCGWATSDATSPRLPCFFNCLAHGEPAKAMFGEVCMWCSASKMKAAHTDGRVLESVAKGLAALKEANAGQAYEAAVARLAQFGDHKRVVELSEEFLSDPEKRRRLLGRPALSAKAATCEPDWFAAPSFLTAEQMLLIEPHEPAPGEPILILQKKYWDLAVTGKKSIEIRRQSLRPMRRYVGHSGEIWGTMRLGSPMIVSEQEKWLQLMPYHHMNSHELPYKRTLAHPILDVEVFKCPVQYMALLGQVGHAAFRPCLQQGEHTRILVPGESSTCLQQQKWKLPEKGKSIAIKPMEGALEKLPEDDGDRAKRAKTASASR